MQHLRVTVIPSISCCFFFFFNDTATTEIYTLSLHDALPILWAAPRAWGYPSGQAGIGPEVSAQLAAPWRSGFADRKSTRLNSSHSQISYAVFCLKKKKKKNIAIKRRETGSASLTAGRHTHDA